ncbi:MAG TPA: YfiR family protein [Terriglobia bacterium]|nr:YfiR family protein [Terriglobia bacterium]
MIKLKGYKPQDAGAGSSRRDSGRRLLLTGRTWLIAACALLLLGPSNARSQSAESAEYPVKLGFLYNFAKFVDWPPDAFPSGSAPFEICMAGHDPFKDELERSLRGRTVGTHPIDLMNDGPMDDLRRCHIVFITRDAKKRTASIVARLKGSRVLTVGEAQGFAAQGGVIGFVVEGNRVRFEINRQAAKDTGLKISSKLLALARIVKEEDTADRGRSPSLVHPP